MTALILTLLILCLHYCPVAAVTNDHMCGHSSGAQESLVSFPGLTSSCQQGPSPMGALGEVPCLVPLLVAADIPVLGCASNCPLLQALKDL